MYILSNNLWITIFKLWINAALDSSRLFFDVLRAVFAFGKIK